MSDQSDTPETVTVTPKRTCIFTFPSADRPDELGDRVRFTAGVPVQLPPARAQMFLTFEAMAEQDIGSMPYPPTQQ
ncbi:MAG: hypothetical protein KGN16_10370 [Burkholderiales bacterium]|nr:hypothetical protein [Burkholderiales bacterium]